MNQCPKCGFGQASGSAYCSVCGSLIQQTRVVQSENLHQWEKRENSLFGSFFKLISKLLSSPSTIFAQVTPRSNMGSAFLFYILLVLITAPVLLLFQDNSAAKMYEDFGPQFQYLQVLIQPLLTMILGITSLFISAGFLQLLFIITKVKKAAYRETLIALCYTAAPMIFYLIPLPLIPQLIAGIWAFVLQVIGMAELHKVGRGKMFLIQFIPVLIIWMMLFFFIILLVTILVSTGIYATEALPYKDLFDLFR